MYGHNVRVGLFFLFDWRSGLILHGVDIFIKLFVAF